MYIVDNQRQLEVARARAAILMVSGVLWECGLGTYQQDCLFEDEIEIELYILTMATDDGCWLPELGPVCRQRTFRD